MKKITAVLSMAMLLPAIALAQRPDNRGSDHNARGQQDHAYNGDRGYSQGGRNDQRSTPQNQGRNDQRWTPQSQGRNDQRWTPQDQGRGNDRYDRGREYREDRRDDRRYDRDDRYIARDVRYELARPYAYGRFGYIGPRFVFRIEAGGPVRFRVGGGWFEVAAFDQDYARAWFWNTDNIVINDDPDHFGWYLAYNTRLGTSVHVQYVGSD